MLFLIYKCNKYPSKYFFPKTKFYKFKRKKQNELVLRDSLKALSNLRQAFLRKSKDLRSKVIEVQICVAMEDGDMVCLSIEKIEGQKKLERHFEHLSASSSEDNNDEDTPPLLLN